MQSPVYKETARNQRALWVGGKGSWGGVAVWPARMADSYRKAIEDANKANEARYSDLIQGRYNLMQRQMAALEGSGAQERKDLEDQYRDRSATLDQDLVSRGLTNTTVRDTMQGGNLEL